MARIFVLLILLASCARGPLVHKRDALIPVSPPELADDLDITSLVDGIRQQVAHLEKKNPRFIDFRFGETHYTKAEYLEGLKGILAFANEHSDKRDVIEYIHSNFDFYEVYGREKPGQVLITSYYEPIIPGSKKKTSTYTMPLYKVPPDMVEVQAKDTDLVDDEWRELPKGMMIARLTKDQSIRGLTKVVPYYTRSEIDTKHVLKGKNLEYCFVDPVEAFFLHIQGSGTVMLEGGETLRLGYTAQNGRPYASIGKILEGKKIPVNEMSMQRLEEYFRSLPPDEMMRLLALNPSYVFFKPLEGRPLTTLGTEVIDGRTIATDMKFFPKGALGFMVFPKPISNEMTSRFVLDQDTGGAIFGGGRVDLYWGSGDDAKKYAGAMKNMGTLYYLAPKRK